MEVMINMFILSQSSLDYILVISRWTLAQIALTPPNENGVEGEI